jgi:hypothetical protein
MQKAVELINNNQTDFLKYLKSRFTLIHLSNVFFRDIHYGVMSYLQEHGVKARYQEAEEVTRQVAAKLVQNGIFKPIDHQSWLLNYPDFALPKVEKKPAAVPTPVA